VRSAVDERGLSQFLRGLAEEAVQDEDLVGHAERKVGRMTPTLVLINPNELTRVNKGASVTWNGSIVPSRMRRKIDRPAGRRMRLRAYAASAEMNRPSGTLMTVMMKLLNTVVLTRPGAQAREKLRHSKLVGGAKALDPITVELGSPSEEKIVGWDAAQERHRIACLPFAEFEKFRVTTRLDGLQKQRIGAGSQIRVARVSLHSQPIESEAWAKMNDMDVEVLDIDLEDSVEVTPCLADEEPVCEGLTVADLMASSCRWPSGDPRDLRTFRYCGDTACGGPYCERHARLAYLSRAT
jgi:hypothetical protein